MSARKSAQLLEFILERERLEKKKKQKRALTLAGITAGVGVASLLIFLVLGGYSDPAIPVYSLADLDQNRVVSLLREAPAGLKVADVRTGDTVLLKDLQDYTLLQAAIADQNLAGVSPAEMEENLGELTEGATITLVSTEGDAERAREIQRKIASDGPLSEADIMPAFPGGESALRRFLSRQLRYPIEASRQKVEGTVYLRFVINAEGKIESPEVMRGIGGGCDEEALRVLSQMPPWNPGEVAGVKVPVFPTLAINSRFL